MQSTAVIATALFLSVSAARADTPKRPLADTRTANAGAETAPKPPAAAPAPAGPSMADLTAFIDAQVDAKIAEQNLKPSPRADDAEFLRRVTLDLTGRIPTAEDTVVFLKDRDPGKRAKKIDALLASPAWVDHWTTVWMNLLAGRTRKIQEMVVMDGLRKWLHAEFEKNTPWDALVKSLLTATGRSDENGAVLYLLRFRDSPPDAVGSIVRTFCGVQLQCCQCHNHPYEKYTQEQFWSMAGFLVRTKPRVVEKPDKGMPIVELIDLPRGEAVIPDLKKQVEAKFFLNGEKPDPKAVRRGELVRFLISPSNPTFGKALANRVWYLCFGRGLVDPVDDFREADPGTHPELLDGMAQAFVRGGYDVKALLRAVMNTRAYQRASRPLPENKDDAAYYTHALLRVQTPEALLDSLLLATGTDFGARIRTAEAAEQLKRRIVQRFVFLFDNDEMREVTEFEGTIPQALMLLNGQLTNGGVGGAAAMAARLPKGRENASRTPRGRPGIAIPALDEILDAYKDPGDRIDQLFLRVLSRPAETEERARYAAYVRKNGDDRDAYEDVAWTLLNSSEFLYIH